MENKKNGCGCNGNSPLKEDGAEAESFSPKNFEIKTTKGTMTRVGNQILIGEASFPELRAVAPEAGQLSVRPAMRESAARVPLENQGGRVESLRYSGGDVVISDGVIEELTPRGSVFLTDFDVPLVGAQNPMRNPARFLLQDGSGGTTATPAPKLSGEKRRDSEGLDRPHGGVKMKLPPSPNVPPQEACKCDVSISIIDAMNCPDLPRVGGEEDATKGLPAWQQAVCQAFDKRVQFLQQQNPGLVDVVQPKDVSDDHARQGIGLRRLGAARTKKIVANGKAVVTGHQYFIAVLIGYSCDCTCDMSAQATRPCYSQFKVGEKEPWIPDAVVGGYRAYLSAQYEGVDAFDNKRCYRAFVDSIGNIADAKAGEEALVPGPAERKLKGKATVSRKNPDCYATAEAEWVVKSAIDESGIPTGSVKITSPVKVQTFRE